MKKVSKVLICILVLALTCTVISACSSKQAGVNEAAKKSSPQEMSSEDSRYGGTITVAKKMSVPHLDSDKSTDWQISSIMNHVYEGLFEFDSNFKAQPHLAKSYKISDNGKVYNIKLRKGVLFHNGKEMTAEDISASFNRWLKNNGAGKMVAPYFDKA